MSGVRAFFGWHVLITEVRNITDHKYKIIIPQFQIVSLYFLLVITKKLNLDCHIQPIKGKPENETITFFRKNKTKNKKTGRCCNERPTRKYV